MTWALFALLSLLALMGLLLLAILKYAQANFDEDFEEDDF